MTARWILYLCGFLHFTISGMGDVRAAPMATSGEGAQWRARFDELDRGAWKTVFEDPGADGWRAKWFLDGEVATVENSPQGMEMASGPESRNNAHHAVLWTKQSFSGDVRIEYDFTRLDKAAEGVNILYVQATGSGKDPYVEDIAAWSHLRKVPAMKMYYNYMHTYHISYAVGYPASEYVRLRRYRPETTGLKGTEIFPDYGRSDLFQIGIPYRMTLIKSGQQIFLRVRGGGRDDIYHWRNESADPIVKGRIGLRQMWGKHSRYANFRICERPRFGLDRDRRSHRMDRCIKFPFVKAAAVGCQPIAGRLVGTLGKQINA